jgi:putative transcriptional regulator
MPDDWPPPIERWPVQEKRSGWRSCVSSELILKMNKKAFAEMVSSVQDMGRHMRGEKVAGARVTKVREPNVRTIRRKTGLSQSQFAVLIGMNLRTLQNWEQGRTRPTGPARALLRIVEKNPKVMLTLHVA